MKLVCTLLLLFPLLTFAQTNRNIAFYNVENLFDTTNHETDDDFYTPSGRLEWDDFRYRRKLYAINEVIDSLENPVLLGMCEVENKKVLIDLVKLKNKSFYGIVHQESQDEKGLDVALLYDQRALILLEQRFVRFKLDNKEHPYTRDILCAKFIAKKDTVFAIVNHWPGRHNGQVESEGNRLKAAHYAGELVDSIQTHSPKSKIIFMGDLNDYPTNLSVQLISDRLDPMISDKSGKYGGSYSYRNEYNVVDHIFISKNATKKKHFKVRKNSGKIFDPLWLTHDHKGNILPKRTLAGRKYLGGYSDHFPIVIEVSLR